MVHLPGVVEVEAAAMDPAGQFCASAPARAVAGALEARQVLEQSFCSSLDQSPSLEHFRLTAASEAVGNAEYILILRTDRSVWTATGPFDGDALTPAGDPRTAEELAGHFLAPAVARILQHRVRRGIRTAKP